MAFTHLLGLRRGIAALSALLGRSDMAKQGSDGSDEHTVLGSGYLGNGCGGTKSVCWGHASE